MTTVQRSNRRAHEASPAPAPVAAQQPKRTATTNPVYATSTGATTNEATLEVYAPGFKGILVIPRRNIFHTPAPDLHVTRLVLCANFDAANPQNSCSMGSRCKFVHADTAQAMEHDVHVNYAWRSIEEVTYECFPAAEGMLDIAPPNGTIAEVAIPAQYILKTNALKATRRPLSHCAHYFYNRACNRGSECNFIHVVYIDPEARAHQRAPVPSQIATGRRLPRPPLRQTYYRDDHDECTELCHKPQKHHHRIGELRNTNSSSLPIPLRKSAIAAVVASKEIVTTPSLKEAFLPSSPNSAVSATPPAATSHVDENSSDYEHHPATLSDASTDDGLPLGATYATQLPSSSRSLFTAITSSIPVSAKQSMRYQYNPYSFTSPLVIVCQQ